LGGFTTFSAFSLEAVTLYERGDVTQAALYVALSVGLSIAGLIAGLWLARGLLTRSPNLNQIVLLLGENIPGESTSGRWGQSPLQSHEWCPAN